MNLKCYLKSTPVFGLYESTHRDTVRQLWRLFSASRLPSFSPVLFLGEYSFSSEWSCERPKPGRHSWLLLSSLPSSFLIPNLHIGQSDLSRMQMCQATSSPMATQCSQSKVIFLTWLPRPWHGLALPGSPASFPTTLPIALCP